MLKTDHFDFILEPVSKSFTGTVLAKVGRKRQSRNAAGARSRGYRSAIEAGSGPVKGDLADTGAAFSLRKQESSQRMHMLPEAKSLVGRRASLWTKTRCQDCLYRRR